MSFITERLKSKLERQQFEQRMLPAIQQLMAVKQARVRGEAEMRLKDIEARVKDPRLWRDATPEVIGRLNAQRNQDREILGMDPDEQGVQDVRPELWPQWVNNLQVLGQTNGSDAAFETAWKSMEDTFGPGWVAQNHVDLMRTATIQQAQTAKEQPVQPSGKPGETVGQAREVPVEPQPALPGRLNIQEPQAGFGFEDVKALFGVPTRPGPAGAAVESAPTAVEPGMPVEQPPSRPLTSITPKEFWKEEYKRYTAVPKTLLDMLSKPTFMETETSLNTLVRMSGGSEWIEGQADYYRAGGEQIPEGPVRLANGEYNWPLIRKVQELVLEGARTRRVQKVWDKMATTWRKDAELVIAKAIPGTTPEQLATMFYGTLPDAEAAGVRLEDVQEYFRIIGPLKFKEREDIRQKDEQQTLAQIKELGDQIADAYARPARPQAVDFDTIENRKALWAKWWELNHRNEPTPPMPDGYASMAGMTNYQRNQLANQAARLKQGWAGIDLRRESLDLRREQWDWEKEHPGSGGAYPAEYRLNDQIAKEEDHISKLMGARQTYFDYQDPKTKEWKSKNYREFKPDELKRVKELDAQLEAHRKRLRELRAVAGGGMPAPPTAPTATPAPTTQVTETTGQTAKVKIGGKEHTYTRNQCNRFVTDFLTANGVKVGKLSDIPQVAKDNIRPGYVLKLKKEPDNPATTQHWVVVSNDGKHVQEVVTNKSGVKFRSDRTVVGLRKRIIEVHNPFVKQSDIDKARKRRKELGF